MSRLKQLLEERAEAQKKIDSIYATAEKESRGLTSDEKEERNKLEDKYEELNEEISKAQKNEERKAALAAENAKKEEERKAKEKKEEEAKIDEGKKETVEYRNFHAAEMLQGVIGKDEQRVADGFNKLKEGGHYKGMEETRDGFSTLKDTKGGIFLPTSISNEIMDMVKMYGAIPRFSKNVGVLSGSLKIPSILSKPKFSAVNERSSIVGSGASFGGMKLDPLKWGAIIDWTNEIGAEAGSRLIPIIQQQMAEAEALLLDDVVFNANGTSAYHSLKGVLNLAGVKNHVAKDSAGTGRTSFGALKAEDWLNLTLGTSPSVRKRGVFVTHPDQEVYLRQLKDDNGTFIYGGPAVGSEDVGTLWGRPIFFTEAFVVEDGSDKPYAAYYDPNFLVFATGQNMAVKSLDQASISDEDGNTINLATQDASALRFTELFDFEMSDVTTTTNGVKKGAFAVGYTAA